MRRVNAALVAERVERVDDALHAGPVQHGDRARLLIGEARLGQDFAGFAAHGRATFHGPRFQGSVLLGTH